MRRSKSPRCSDEYKRDGRATRQNRYEQTGERMRISLARSLVEWTRNEPRENVQLREWEICLRNEDRFRDDHHPTPSTPRPSYFLTRQTTRRSFISFFFPPPFLRSTTYFPSTLGYTSPILGIFRTITNRSVKRQFQSAKASTDSRKNEDVTIRFRWRKDDGAKENRDWDRS